MTLFQICKTLLVYLVCVWVLSMYFISIEMHRSVRLFLSTWFVCGCYLCISYLLKFIALNGHCYTVLQSFGEEYISCSLEFEKSPFY